MKIYLFNPETGIYLGEDYADEASMKRGSFVVPPDAYNGATISRTWPTAGFQCCEATLAHSTAPGKTG
jgi:hypothetical protein